MSWKTVFICCWAPIAIVGFLKSFLKKLTHKAIHMKIKNINLDAGFYGPFLLLYISRLPQC